MNWLLLVVAGLFECGFATCLAKLKSASGTSATLWSIGFFLCLSISMYLLYFVSKTLPIGTAYVVWTGIGATGTAVAGIIFFDEPADAWRIFFMLTLIGSIVGLKVVSNS
jgi:quaternary ammonium compound-resistance protein SugE